MTSTPTDPRPPSDPPTHPRTDPPTPERLTVRSPDDALAAVPVILGFEPEESVVVLTFGGRETFHARVDLPGESDLDETVDQMVGPCLHHGVAGVVLLVYSADADLADLATDRAVQAFADVGIEVLATICADGRRWRAPGWPGLHDEHDRPAEGTPYDASAHRFRAQSVLRGRVVHPSRSALATLLEPDPAGVAGVRRARRRSASVDATGVTVLVERGVAAGRLGDPDLVVLLLSLRRPTGRDAAWAHITRADAEDHVRFWTDAVQRAPADLVAGPAAVLAMAAWLAGHGALAWCAIDRCRAVDPRNTLAGLVDQALTHALSPSVWDGVRDELGSELGLAGPDDAERDLDEDPDEDSQEPFPPT